MHESELRSEPAGLDRRLKVLPWALLALAVWVFLRTAWLCDDAYITFRVVDNFVHGYGLRWNVAERVQVSTHPLWMLALTVPYALTREIYYTSLFSCLVLSVVTVWWIAFRIARTPAAGLLGVAILISSRAFVDYSSSGLENPLTHLLLALFAWRVSRPLASTREVLWASALAGLGLLNRLDTALLFLPALAYGVRGRHRTPRSLAALLPAMLPLALWLAFATFYYGFPFPNTALAKLNTGIGFAERLDHGLAYCWNSLSGDPVTLVTIAAALAAAVLARAKDLLAVALAPLLYVAYVVSIGGDFMSGRFFTAPLVCAVVVLVSPELRVRDTWRAAALCAASIGGLVVPHPVLASGPEYGLYRDDLVDDRGIADERGYYYWMTGLLDAREGPKPRNVDVSRIRAWRRCGYPLAIEGAVGFLGFNGGPALHVVDFHGLADPLLSRLPAVERDPAYEEFCRQLRGAPCLDPVRIGHFTRTIPPGYLSFILGRGGSFEDRHLAQFVEKLAFVTRGPLLDRERLAEVVRFNLGHYDPLLEAAAHRRYAPPRWQEVVAILGDSAPGQPYRELEARELPEAERAFRQALAGCPEDTDAAVNLAIVLWLEGRDREALDLCLAVTRLDPWNARAANGLGHAYARLGQTAAALAAFDRAIGIDPTMKEAHFGRAMTCFELGREADAREAWTRAAILGSDEARAALRKLEAAD